MSSSCIQRICDKNSITQFRRGGALVYKWVLLPMFVNAILGLAFGLCKWIWCWLLCSIRLALNNTKKPMQKPLKIFLSCIWRYGYNKASNLVGHSKKQNTCACEHFVFWNVWAFHVMPHVNFCTGWHLRGAYFQDSLVLTTSGRQALTSRTPCSSGATLPQTHTSKACTQMSPTHTSITIQINNGSWVSNKDLE
jgi:hypothetical protein